VSVPLWLFAAVVLALVAALWLVAAQRDRARDALFDARADREADRRAAAIARGRHSPALRQTIRQMRPRTPAAGDPPR
jgi:hypothetical protein